MKVLIKSAWGSDDPTKAAFAFLHANAFAEAGFVFGESACFAECLRRVVSRHSRMSAFGQKRTLAQRS